jgi:hypothetical protein
MSRVPAPKSNTTSDPPTGTGCLQYRDEVLRGGDRLGDHCRLRPSGPPGRLAEQVAPVGSPRHRIREGQWRQEAAHLQRRVGDGAQDRGEHVEAAYLAVAEQDDRLVDAPFRVGLVAAGIEHGDPDRVPADDQLAVDLEVDRRRQHG